VVAEDVNFGNREVKIVRASERKAQHDEYSSSSH